MLVVVLLVVPPGLVVVVEPGEVVVVVDVTAWGAPAAPLNAVLRATPSIWS